MIINYNSREINIKIVYTGSARSGKTTNLEYIHANTAPQLRGKLLAIKTYKERTLFFDYMQLELGTYKGFKPKFNLYTVPGQIHYASNRKIILQGVDGIVFVVDSQPYRLRATLIAYKNLYQQLHELGIEPRNIPIVFQFNKRDVKNAVAVDTLRRVMRIDRRIICHEAMAISGQGVFETLKSIINKVMNRVKIDAKVRKGSPKRALTLLEKQKDKGKAKKKKKKSKS
jgi:signal recognition particle receptor subunit beta